MNNSHKPIPPGWVGGFAQSDPAFAYPDPDLSSLPMLDNLANIDKLQRQWDVLWPEFSWETEPGNPDSRCYQMFAPDISRLGYTDEGRVYSIICPQQGVCTAHFGCLNIEVTVTGQRGWADEDNREMAGDMTVEGKIWFSPSAMSNSIVKYLWRHFSHHGHPFPASKAEAIVVETHDPGNPGQPIFPIRTGQSSDFPIPDFAKHEDEAWTVAHLGVEIGEVRKTGDEVADRFNEMVMEAFNLFSGNLLAPGNTLSWNVWCTQPQLVDQEEWRQHAEKWRHSIDADHGSPDGPGTSARFFDGSKFEPVEAAVQHELKALMHFIESHI